MEKKNLIKFRIKRTAKNFFKLNNKYQAKKMNKKNTHNMKLNMVFYKGNKAQQLCDMMDKIKITINSESYFMHWIDESVVVYNHDSMIGNMPPDYSNIINYSIDELLVKNQKKDTVSKQNKILLTGVRKYIQKILLELYKVEQSSYVKAAQKHFKNMLNKKAETLDDALQRILLWSSLFWQAGHRLVGLGRLDYLLNRFADEKNHDKNVNSISAFLYELHNYYEFKSSALLGDIGQIIILGGVSSDEQYFCNDLTYCFIEALAKAKIPDPKILLRVSEKMPKKLVDCAISCISTGIGSPLLSNDDVVIPSLEEFGYDPEDACNYVTSACWEPLSYGNSLEQNNLFSVQFAYAFVDTLKMREIVDCRSFEQFFDLYMAKLFLLVKEKMEKLSFIRWEKAPFYTLFTDGCKDSKKDISDGGAKYNNYGILSVGLSNAVNSLLNIKTFVFEKKEYSLSEIHRIWTEHNVKHLNMIAEKMQNEYKWFGHDSKSSIFIVNAILEGLAKEISNYRNRYGGKIKFGLSSPSYVDSGKIIGYTFDGRKEGAPLETHISAGDGIAYTELVSFASKIHYGGIGSNGNVVDYFVSPDFIHKNREIFSEFLTLSIKQGFFQMQMNVVGSDELIRAKKTPEFFKNLIVRVWGFSAYFVDLPEEYQDVLIERALKSEGKIA